MPLPEPATPRRRLHTRRVQIEGFLREDGNFDLDATLCDVKDADYVLLSGVRVAGEPLHEMHMRITVDPRFTVLAIEAESLWVPYAGYCEAIAPAYESLVGLNLLSGFRKAVQERLGDVRGCSHLTELILQLPTAALQTLATLLPEDVEPDGGKPFQLDRCHALDSRGDAVRTYYPRWHVNKTN